jgi:predicted RNA-binding protein with PUA-like domain
MQYWLMKSEPDVWSIDQQKRAGVKGAPWDGVRNYQAAKNLKIDEEMVINVFFIIQILEKKL